MLRNGMEKVINIPFLLPWKKKKAVEKILFRSQTPLGLCPGGPAWSVIMLQGCMGEWVQYCLLKLTHRSIYSIFAWYIAHVLGILLMMMILLILDVFFSNSTIICSLSTLNNINYSPWYIIAISFNETLCNLFDGTHVVSMWHISSLPIVSKH